MSRIKLCHGTISVHKRCVATQQGLRLDVKLVSLCYNTPICSQDRIGGVITGKIRALQGLYLKGYDTTYRN